MGNLTLNCWNVTKNNLKNRFKIPNLGLNDGFGKTKAFCLDIYRTKLKISFVHQDYKSFKL